MSKITIKNAYCDALFNEIYTNPNGNYRFCCFAQMVPDEYNMNSKTHTPFEWFKSDYMEEVRNGALQGVKHPACIACWKMEEAGGESFRTMRYNQHSYTDITDVKLNLALSNACNLSCYMCGPENSTTKHKEMVEVFGKNSKYSSAFFGLGFALKQDNYKRLKKDILNHITYVKAINLIGGEPMMIPEVWDLLDSISNADAKNIRLCWITNMTKVGYKNYSLEDIIKKFKEVSFNVSCDHYGIKESWIRYPIDIQSFEANLRKYKKYISQIQVTVGMLNATDLIEIRDYYNSNFKLNVDFTNIVYSVTSGDRGGVTIMNFPKEHKLLLIDKYKNDSDFKLVVEMLSSSLDDDCEELYKDAMDFCQKLSDHRKFQFKDIWDNIPL